jgi:hypothetical protein
VSIEKVQPRFWQGSHVTFRDDGYISPGSSTRKFAVLSKLDNSLLGYVKWFNNWRQYTFFPLGSVLIKTVLREIADFCEETTKAHKQK